MPLRMTLLLLTTTLLKISLALAIWEIEIALGLHFVITHAHDLCFTSKSKEGCVEKTSAAICLTMSKS